jgi:hypothetical protein
MEMEHAWKVIWQDKKKHITFIDADGHKVRDTNISKTFSMNISKDDLLKELDLSRIRKEQLSRRPHITRKR